MHVPIPGKLRQVGTVPRDVNGVVVFQSVTAAECHVAGPGEEVELPLTEIKQLQVLGFLVDPNRIATDAEVKKADALARNGHPRA